MARAVFHYGNISQCTSRLHWKKQDNWCPGTDYVGTRDRRAKKRSSQWPNPNDTASNMYTKCDL